MIKGYDVETLLQPETSLGEYYVVAKDGIFYRRMEHSIFDVLEYLFMHAPTYPTAEFDLYAEVALAETGLTVYRILSNNELRKYIHDRKENERIQEMYD